MHVQPHLNPHMRSILIDWLVEVAQEYALLPDTLHLACSLIDRYLGSPRGEKVAHTRLQLVGVSALLIASKYEEVRAPQVEELCFITDNTYTKDEVSTHSDTQVTIARSSALDCRTCLWLHLYVVLVQYGTYGTL